MRPEAGSPAAWVRFARSDLALARQQAGPEIVLESLCFHAQQAVEKALKAVLIHFGTPIPRVHNIARLVDLLPESVERVLVLTEAAALTDYAVASRYPSDDEIDEGEHAQSVRIAAAVVAWAEDVIGL
jgi:HEPN domain-containing protein